MEKIEIIIKQLIESYGEDVKRDGLSKTPRRVASAWNKALSGYNIDPADIITTFDDESYDEMIVVRDIEFYSTCEHHLLPFFGKAHIGYLPNGKIIGLSKIPRVVDVFSRRLQNQERLTSQIAESLTKLLHPKGVGVVIEARHLCMMARGVEKQGSHVITSAMRGLFKKNDNTRSEFLRLIGK
ncbi:MAG: GTP cyclohydrolase 1 [Candidatus Peregrinibacteria bacterium GW2011_GWA2_47_7]|nr:MAG: GTP cyclohydrolase 1 [Candidatus Peregrinibacteria bacterium GW2011_GWA2_47_7]